MEKKRHSRGGSGSAGVKPKFKYNAFCGIIDGQYQPSHKFAFEITNMFKTHFYTLFKKFSLNFHFFH